MDKPCPVVHFEMPYDDRQRMAKFYEKAFGWRARMLGPEMGEYVLAGTSESVEPGAMTPGVINGGFFKKQPGMPAPHPCVVIAVEDIGAAMKQVKAAKGQVLGEPMEIPGIGRYVSFMDTEGNRVSMLQPSPNMAHGSCPA